MYSDSITKRLISVEFLRSVVLIFFILLSAYRVAFSILPISDRMILSISQLGVAFPYYLSNMAKGLISFLFGLSVIWSISSRLRKGVSFCRILFEIFLFSIFSLFLDFFTAWFLSPIAPLPFSGEIGGGAFTLSLNQGVLTFPPIEQIFQSGFFSMFGFTTLLSVCLFIFLIKTNKYFNLPIVAIVTFIAIMWLLFLGDTTQQSLRLGEDFYNRGGFYRIFSFFIYNWGGRSFAANVVVPYSLFGAIMGYQIAVLKRKRDFYAFGLYSVLLLVGFFIFFAGTDYIATRLGRNPVGVGNFIFQNNSRLFFIGNLIVQYLIMIPLASIFDYREKGFPKIWKLTAIPRQWGRIFLTVLILNPFISVFLAFLKDLLGESFPVLVSSGVMPYFFIAFTLLFWFFLLELWRKVHFIGCFEHLIFRFLLFFQKNKKFKTLSSSDFLKCADRFLFYFDSDVLQELKDG